MELLVKETFNKDISKIRDRKTLLSIKQALQEIALANSLADIGKIRKLQGLPHYYRIRIGDYRMGIYLENNVVIVARFLHRREIYRYFP